MAITTCIFDACGMLFDVTAAARAAGSEPGHGHGYGRPAHMLADLTGVPALAEEA